MADTDAAAPVAAPNEPYRQYNFRVEIADLGRGHFASVVGPRVEITPIRWREGGDNQIVRLFTGPTDYGPVTLRFGFIKGDSAELWNWLLGAMTSKVTRKNVSIVNLSAAGDAAVATLNLFDAWPSVWDAERLDALGREFVVHSLTLVYESLTLT
jgi:phage tail-like protein